jgi:FkbM family methyltransferase
VRLSANTFRPTVRTFVRKATPGGVRQVIRYALDGVGGLNDDLKLAWLRGKVRDQNPGYTVQFLNYTARINDGPNFYNLYKDIFVHRFYHFEAQRPNPLIIDGGSNIGMSILYFKHVYPQARIIGFEPDPGIFPYLEQNMEANRLTDVRVVRAALAGQEGALTFFSDGKYGSYLAGDSTAAVPENWTKHEVPCIRLRDYLTDPVDFLKLNIEGAEWDVLADSEPMLRQIREIVIEYHHLPGLHRTLHKILALLHDHGFEYLINSFDSETNRGVIPPFCLAPESKYFLLIYAKRLD